MLKQKLAFIDELFTSVYPSARDEQKQIMDELKSSLKKAKTEIDTDLPAFINRMNAVWHETGRLLR
jgi:hypothetical protein